MKSFHRPFLAFGALALLSLACSLIYGGRQAVQGSGVLASQERSAGKFSAIEVVGSADVDVTVGDTRSLVVEADDNLLPLIETNVRGGTLTIRTQPGVSISPRMPIHISVTMESLRSARIAGSGNITVNGLDGGSPRFELPGSGNITAQGTAEQVTISLDGSGNILCGDLQAQSARVTLNGSGNVTVFASQSLDVTVRGSGTVSYCGHPDRINQSIPGSGSVNAIP